MDNLELEEWRRRLRFKKCEVADRLGLHPNTVGKYSRGESKIPKVVALACDALSLGLRR